MPKLQSLTQGKIIKIFQSNGFKQVRSRKHITFKKTDFNGKVRTTWVPHHKKITLFVTKYIIRQTGKSREEFY